MLAASRHRDDAGFTLVELIVAVVIMAIVVSAISMAFVMSYRTTVDANDRMSQASDAQLLATYWPADVASLDAIGYMAAPTCGSGTELVTFAWDLSGPGTSETRVTYAASGTGAGSEVLRYRCTGADTTPVSTIVVARSFGTKGSAAGAATWVKGKNGAGSPSCDTATCTIHLAGSYPFEVTAHRRVPGESNP